MNHQENHNQGVEKVEKLLKELKKDHTNSEIDANFVNNLKFKLKDEYETKTSSNWLSFFTNSRVFAGAVAGLLIAVLVVQINSNKQINFEEEEVAPTTVEDKAEDSAPEEANNEAKSLKFEKTVNNIVSQPAPGESNTSNEAPAVEESTSNNTEETLAEGDDGFEEEAEGAASSQATLDDTESAIMPAPAVVEEEYVETTLIILNVSSIEEAATKIKSDLASFGAKVHHDLSYITESKDSASLEMSVPMGQIANTMAVLIRVTTDGQTLGASMLHEAPSIGGRIYFELMLFLEE